MSLMKAVQVQLPGAGFEFVDKEVLEPKDYEIRIRVEACGVCHGAAIVKNGHFSGMQYPRVTGHEVVGIIDKRGVNMPETWRLGIIYEFVF